MSGGDRLPAVRVGSWAMLVLPVEIDAACAQRVAGALDAAMTGGVSVLVADLSGTAFCDSSGVRALMGARAAALARGVDLRLVVPSATVRRVFELMGVEELLPVYATLGAAMTGAPAREHG